MNDAFDNASADRDTLEKYVQRCQAPTSNLETDDSIPCDHILPCPMHPAPERHDPETGEVFDEDAPAGSGWDSDRHCATDLRGADWAGRKLREAQEQLLIHFEACQAELRALAKKEEEATARYERSVKPFRETIRVMENVLRVFAETHRDEVLKGLRKKSRLLPSGVTIGWRSERGGYRWDQSKTPAESKAALLAWAQARPTFERSRMVQQQPVVDLAEVKRFLGPGGPSEAHPLPPGLEYVAPGQEELYVSTGVETKEEP